MGINRPSDELIAPELLIPGTTGFDQHPWTHSQISEKEGEKKEKKGGKKKKGRLCLLNWSIRVSYRTEMYSEILLSLDDPVDSLFAHSSQVSEPILILRSFSWTCGFAQSAARASQPIPSTESERRRKGRGPDKHFLKTNIDQLKRWWTRRLLASRSSRNGKGSPQTCFGCSAPSACLSFPVHCCLPWKQAEPAEREDIHVSCI